MVVVGWGGVGLGWDGLGLGWGWGWGGGGGWEEFMHLTTPHIEIVISALSSVIFLEPFSNRFQTMRCMV